ncbi:MAG TPA: HAD-IA family hydrolase [Prolixibacteraceae bacterium]|nr:HAD-IA family hydrolase [Prolixibacteraceae bacterium]
MKKSISVTTLFVDIGGVLLTDGWSHEFRKLAVREFNLDPEEMENRHSMVFETFEIGKLTIDEYLNLVVFYQPRSFTRSQFQEFMFARSESDSKMIGLIRQLKAKYGLKIVVVSNESRELNAHRIQKFKLNEFVDSFISSCYVGLRKPNADIFRLALDVAQVPAEQIVFIENTQMFVQIAEGLGIRGIWHTDYQSTREKLASFGLEVEK